MIRTHLVHAALLSMLLISACSNSQPATIGELASIAHVFRVPASDQQSTFWSVTSDHFGRLVAAGQSWTDSSGAMLVARFLPDGTLDSSFGTQGVVSVTPPVGDTFGASYDVIVDTQSRIVLCGAWLTPTPDEAKTLKSTGVLVRLLQNGSPDSTFGVGGVTDLPDVAFGENNSCRQTRQAGDNYIVLGVNSPEFIDAASFVPVYPTPDAIGIATRPFSAYGYLAKLDSGGVLDPTFGVLGAVQINTDAAPDFATDRRMNMDSFGRIYVKYHEFRGAAFVADLYVNRYLADGSLDPSFGDQGRRPLVQGQNGHAGLGSDIAVAQDGTSWISGASLSPFAGDPLVSSIHAAMWTLSSAGAANDDFTRVVSDSSNSVFDEGLLWLARSGAGYLAAVLVSSDHSNPFYSVVTIGETGSVSPERAALHILPSSLTFEGKDVVAAGALEEAIDGRVSIAAAIEFPRD